MAEKLAPLWEGLERAGARVRALLVALAVAVAAAGTAALLSGRWLTITWAAAAALAALAARGAAERRLLAVAAPTLGLAVVHALSVEAPPSSLVLDRGLDALAPIPSLAALGVAFGVLALTYRFEHRGIDFLGPLDGPERSLDVALDRVGDVPTDVLLRIAAAFGVWLAGLALADRSYDAGQVAATFLWALLGLELVVRNRPLRLWREVAAWVVVPLAYAKAVGFDWDRLGDTAASTSVLGAALALLALGFATRWVDTGATGPLELLAIGVAGLATVSAVEGISRLTDGDDRLFGVGMLAVTATLAGAAAPPFLRWSRRGAPRWARTLATGYWALALASLLLAEAALAAFDETRTLTLWAATAAVLGVLWRVIGEPALWIASLALAVGSAVGVVALVVPPDRLVQASAHPAEGISALLVCVVAAVSVAWRAPAFVDGRGAWLAAAAGVLGVYAFSLLVLEVAERVSGASVETDFQRGHTALSTLLGIAALGVYVVGLARDHRLVRIAGLTLFGLALAKLFLYDLSSLSSITRALSFLALGAVLLAAAFFAERAVHGGQGGSGGHAGPRMV